MLSKKLERLHVLALNLALQGNAWHDNIRDVYCKPVQTHCAADIRN